MEVVPASCHLPLRKQGTFPPPTAQSKTLVLTHNNQSLPCAHHRHD